MVGAKYAYARALMDPVGEDGPVFVAVDSSKGGVSPEIGAVGFEKPLETVGWLCPASRFILTGV